jgi:hypothetical protein
MRHACVAASAPTIWRRARWPLLIVAVAIVARLPALFLPMFDTDEPGHLVHAQRLLAGGWPYLSFVDNKPPLLYVLYAAMAWIARGSLLGVHALTIGHVVATAFVIAAAARQIRGAHPWLAALLYVAFSPSYFIFDGLATNGEVLANLFLAGAAWAYLTRRPWLTGALAAAGALTYPLAGVALIVLATTAGARGALRILAGAAAVFGIAALILAAGGALGPAVEWIIERNLGYAQGYNAPLAGAIRALRSGAGYLLGHGVLVAIAIRALQADASLRRWLGAWLILAALTVSLGGRYYGHYYLIAEVPLCLAASARAGLPSRLAGARRRLWGAALILAAFGFTAVHIVQAAIGDVALADPAFAAIGHAVAARSRPGAPIFVWGYSPAIYYVADRPPATRFVFPQSAAGYLPGTPLNRDLSVDPARYVVEADRAALIADLHARPPAVVVDTAPLGQSAPACMLELCAWGKFTRARFPALDQFLAHGYRRERIAVEAEGHPGYVDLYVRAAP